MRLSLVHVKPSSLCVSDDDRPLCLPLYVQGNCCGRFEIPGRNGNANKAQGMSSLRGEKSGSIDGLLITRSTRVYMLVLTNEH